MSGHALTHALDRRTTRGRFVFEGARAGIVFWWLCVLVCKTAHHARSRHTLSVIMPSRPGPRKIPVGSPKNTCRRPGPRKTPVGSPKIFVPCRAAKRDHLEREFGVSPRSIPACRAARRDHLEREFGSSSRSIPACRAAKRDHLERESGVPSRSVRACKAVTYGVAPRSIPACRAATCAGHCAASARIHSAQGVHAEARVPVSLRRSRVVIGLKFCQPPCIPCIIGRATFS